MTKKIALIIDSTMESEAIASSKSAEHIAYAREILRALGVPDVLPTLLTTDNLANQRVASGGANPTRSRHFLRRYWALHRRIAEGEVTIKYLPDTDQPADFLTKFLGSKKLVQSNDYAINRRSRVDGTAAPPATAPSTSS